MLCWTWIFQLKYSCSSSEDHQFVRGLPIYTISRILDKIISGADNPPLFINGIKRPMPSVRILEVELYPTLLSKARSFGLSDSWIQVIFSTHCSLLHTWVIIPFPLLCYLLLCILMLLSVSWYMIFFRCQTCGKLFDVCRFQGWLVVFFN